MEALGSAASIVALVDVTSKLLSTAKHIHYELRDPPKDLVKIEESLVVINQLLLRVRDVGELQSYHVLRGLDGLTRSLLDMLHTLEGLDVRGGRQSLSKIRWNSSHAKLENQLFLIRHRCNTLVAVLRLAELSSQTLEIPPKSVLGWLSPLDFATTQQETYKRATLDSPSWFLDHAKFQRWVQGPGTTLWCDGVAGAGKTLLCSMVIDHLIKNFQPPDFVGYVYLSSMHNYGAVDIVGSLIKQFILSSGLMSAKLEYWYHGFAEQNARPSLNQAITMLISELQQARRVFLIFDALDEYEGQTEGFLHDLADLFHPNNNLNIFVTSRSTLSNYNFLQHALRLEVRTSDSDIRQYIWQQVSTPTWRRLVCANPELLELLMEETVAQADGMLLYAQLLLKWIESHPALDSSAVKGLLSDSPRNLKDIYLRLLDQLSQKSEKVTKAAFEMLAWLSFAQRPLGTDELQAALAVRIGDDDLHLDQSLPVESLVDVCMGLVALDSRNHHVLLPHYSLQLYLQKWLPEQSKQLCGGPHALITRKCLTYLRLKPFEDKVVTDLLELDGRLRQYPLLSYAAIYWGYHAKLCYSDDLLIPIMRLFTSYHATTAAGMLMLSSEEHTRHYEEAYRGMMGLHIVSHFGLSQVVKHLIHNANANPAARTEGNWTALHWAARRGCEDVVSELLNVSASNSSIIQTTKLDSWTPLHLAAKEGYVNIVEYLRKSGASLNAQDALNRTPLYLACWGGHLPVVRYLLSVGADPNKQNVHGMTALHCATRTGNVDLVEQFLEIGERNRADLNVVDTLGLTALDEAIRKNHKLIAQKLRAAGAKEGLKATFQPGAPGTMTFGAWESLPTDFDWKSYKVDEGRTAKINNGKQCICHVLVKPGSNALMRVFRKTFDISNDKEGRIHKYSLSERQILFSLWHPHIAAYLDSDNDPERNAFLLYMEYCDMGDLQVRHGLSLPPRASKKYKKFGYVAADKASTSTSRPLNGVFLWGLIWQLGSALAYLHHGLTLGHEDEDGVFKAAFDRSWPNQNTTQFIGSSGLLPPEVASGDLWTTKGDIYCLGETIRLTSKSENDLLDTAAFEDFIKVAKGGDESDRMSSLSVMQEAYRVLRCSGRIGELPSSVTSAMMAVDSFLSCGQDGYLLQAFKSVAELLDDSIPFADEMSKKHRIQIVTRLRLLLEDGAEEPFEEHPYEYSAHLLVLLGMHPELDKLLSNKSTDPNVRWKQSGWTPLHLAAQEGSQASVDSLLRHGADKHALDVHGRLLGEYAKDAGFEQMATQLGVALFWDNAKLAVR